MRMSNKNTADTPAVVERYSRCTLPTGYGEFEVVAYRDGAHEHLAIYSGELSGEVLTRVHSECLTGEVFHSLKCDCREQLELALKRIAAEGGAVIYLRQEGRGIGLGNKLRAYEQQALGHDTVDANEVLGFEADPRHYSMVPAILQDLGIESVALMTNNPAKIEALQALGVTVRREPHVVKPHAANRDYLETKRARMKHLLTFD
ncbi:MAG: GTP cyclohydrolase II [Polyangiales bacterium]|jgi:GTP cyclohydrolase II